MIRTISIWIFLSLLICKSLASVETLEIQLLTTQRTPLNLPKIDNLLIHPSRVAAKEYILPFLPPEVILQTYDYFKTLEPNLNFPQLLEAFDFKTILDLKETKILYPFENNISIVYSTKNKKAKIISSPSFELRTFVSSSEQFWVSENSQNCEFWVTFLNKSGEFVTIARGGVSKNEFSKYLEYVIEAHYANSKQFCQKVMWWFAFPYVKYLQCLVHFRKILSRKCCHNNLGPNNFNCRESGTDDKVVSNGFNENCMWLGVVFLLLFSIIGCYSWGFLIYHIILFPFHVLAFPLEFFVLKSNGLSYIVFPYSLCFAISYVFFSQIEKFVINRIFAISPDPTIVLRSFEIQPRNKMWLVPFLIEKNNAVGKNCFVSLLLFLITLVAQIFLWIPFLPIWLKK